MQCVLIAGGAGFIGTNLVKRLLQENKKIVVVDNLCTGNAENVALFSRDDRYSFFEVDISTERSLDFLKERHFDAVFNLACPANPPYCLSHSLEVIRTNVYGTFQLAELAKKWEAIFFQASTSEIYGNPEMTPQKETYFGNVNPCSVRACYDEGKRCAETILYDYHRYFGLDIRTARIFNTYGPYMDPRDGRVIVQFMKHALCGEPLTIYGSGMQTRSFCYIDDLLEGILRLVTLPQMPQSPVNLGNPEEYTILQTAEEILRCTGSRSMITFAPGTPDDPQKRKPDIQQAQQLFKWAPTIPLQEGLVRCLPYFRRPNFQRET